MTREPDPTGFDAIVASWRAEGDVPEWPDDACLDDDARADDLRATDLRPFDPGKDDPPRPAPPGDRPDTTRDTATGPNRPAYRPPGDRPDSARGAGRSAFDPPADRSDPVAHAEDEPAGDRPGLPGAGCARPAERSAEPAHDPFADEHYVPPEPPPLPRMGPPIIVGLLLIGLGLVLVSFPGWVGVPQVYGLPLGLVAIAAGLGWLVLRLWPDPDDVPPPLHLDDPDDPDGGAVL